MSSASKTFVYLVQSKGELPVHYSHIESARSDLILLTWKDRLDRAIYLPHSTWTEGRNRLLEEATRRGLGYLYYIFLDDDIVLEKGDWRLFEQCLLRYRPAAAAPYAPWYPPSKGSRLDREAHTCFYFDAMFSAFHRDIVEDRIVLPYYAGYDQKSWWISQWLVIHLLHHFFPDHVLQVNRVWAANAQHGDYPKGGDWKPARDLLRHSIRDWGLDTPRKLLRKLMHRFAPFREPAKPLASYRISERRKHHELNPSSLLWAK